MSRVVAHNAGPRANRNRDALRFPTRKEVHALAIEFEQKDVFVLLTEHPSTGW